MSRRKPTQPNYQDRLDLLLVAQAGVAALVSSVSLAPDVPASVVWLLGALQAALVVAIAITQRRLHPRSAQEPTEASEGAGEA